MKRGMNLHQTMLKASADLLVGRTIKKVSWMDEEAMLATGWAHRPLVLELDNGIFLWSQADAEGNDGGSLATTGIPDLIGPL